MKMGAAWKHLLSDRNLGIYLTLNTYLTSGIHNEKPFAAPSHQHLMSDTIISLTSHASSSSCGNVLILSDIQWLPDDDTNAKSRKFYHCHHCITVYYLLVPFFYRSCTMSFMWVIPILGLWRVLRRSYLSGTWWWITRIGDTYVTVGDGGNSVYGWQ